MIVLVVGAGRRPLVSACCRAYRILQQQQLQSQQVIPCLKLFVIEKNPSAVLYLHSMYQQSRHDINHPWYHIDITIIHEDLRYITKEKHIQGYIANIVMSELLGSFGCNELSPECFT
jgi:type II protein arginine methyltransferase